MVRVEDFSERHAAEVKRLVIGVHEEFGIGYDPELDADLDRIGRQYGGRGGFWVALDGGRVVGTAALREDGLDSATLKRMYLLPGYRGKGIGLRLLRRAIGHAKENGFGLVQLDTTLRQPRAIRLYERYGFGKIGEEGENLFYRLTI